MNLLRPLTGLLILGVSSGMLLAADETPVEKEEATFPLMKNLVKDRPNLPPPFGAAVLYSWIDTDWKFIEGSVGIDEPNFPAEAAKNTDAKIEVTSVGGKVDLWVLPFLNLFAFGGKLHADNQLLFREVPTGVIPPGIGRPASLVRGDAIVDFTMDGTVFAVGGVLAGGYKSFFASIDFSASQSDFGHQDTVNADQSLTYSAAPRIGYVIGLTQFWLGARYFDYNTRYYGTVPLPNGSNFAFDVTMETQSWNVAAGIRTVLKKHWEVMLEVGTGDRHIITSSVGYRW